MNAGNHPTLITVHARALHALAERPDLRLRQLADHLEVTLRTAQRIVDDLEGLGLLQRVRVGRCNRYRVLSVPWLASAVAHDRRLRRIAGEDADPEDRRDDVA